MDPPATTRHTELAFRGFCVLWASATLFHIASFDKWGDSLTTFALAAAAVAILVRPASVPRLLVLATIQLYSVAVDLPQVSNHWLFTAFVNLTILVTWATLALRRASFSVEPGALVSGFAPTVRIELVALYLFVVLHKLNTDYFDRDTSCGADFWLLQADRFPFLPEGAAFQVASLYMTVAIEAAIPVLLCTRRGRNAGILLALAFHTVIGFNPVSGFYNFSSMLYAALFLFAPEDTTTRLVELCNRLRGRAERLAERLPAAVSLRTAVVAVASAGLCLLLLNVLDKAVDDHFLLVWTLYSACTIALFAAVLLRRGSESPVGGRVFGVPHPALACLPLLVVLNGLSPYLGLKTESSFAMFSNLRTEGSESNHLFVPSGTQLFSFQDDLVEVTSSTSRTLQGLADRNELVPWFEFRALTSETPAAAVTYVRNGSTHRVARIADDPDLSERPRGRKLLVFRPVPLEGPQQCRH